MSPLRRLCGAVPLMSAVLLLVAAAPVRADEGDPTVLLTAPTADAALSAGVATTLNAVVPADVPVRVVSLHLDNGPPICVFIQVHDNYACPWTPPATLVGPHTVLARVETTDGRLALASAPVLVGRALPTAVGSRTLRRHLRGGGWRLSTTGTVAVPAGLTAAACQGRATITVLAGRRTLVDRTVDVRPDCTFAAPRRTRAVRVRVEYSGAPLLAPRAARSQTVRLR